MPNHRQVTMTGIEPQWLRNDNLTERIGFTSPLLSHADLSHADPQTPSGKVMCVYARSGRVEGKKRSFLKLRPGIESAQHSQLRASHLHDLAAGCKRKAAADVLQGKAHAGKPGRLWTSYAPPKHEGTSRKGSWLWSCLLTGVDWILPPHRAVDVQVAGIAFQPFLVVAVKLRGEAPPFVARAHDLHAVQPHLVGETLRR